MAYKDANELTQNEKNQLVCSYAALLLSDGNLDITATRLEKVIKASGNNVEAYWPPLFAKALEGQSIEALIANV